MNPYLHLTADYAAELIENYIHQHQLKPHDRLPAERKLAELWNLNRITLREAIRRLENEHVLYSIKGSGTYIAPSKLRTTTGMNFSFHAYCKANGYQSSSKILNFYQTIGTDFICHKLNIPIHSSVFVLKRLRFLDMRPAMIETTHIAESVCPNLKQHFSSNTYTSLYDTLINYYNIIPEKTKYTLGMIYADSDSAYNLNIKIGTPLLSFDIISLTKADQIIEYCQTLKRMDYFGINSNLYT